MSSTQEVGDIFGAGSGPAHAMLRSPTVLIVSIGLWGMNIFFFRLFGINYQYVLQYDLLKERQELLDQQNDDNGSGEDSLLPATTSTTSPATTPSSSSTTTTTTSNGATINAKNSANITSTGKTIESPPTSNTSNSRSLKPDNKDKEIATTIKKKNEYTPDTSKDGILLDLPFTTNSALDSNVTTQGAAITWYKLVLFSLLLLLVLHSTTHLWIYVMGNGVIGAVFGFYVTVLLYIFIPVPSNQWLRRVFWITLERVYALIHPRCWYCQSTTNKLPRPIPFVDVFFADAMCSLSKVLFDWGMLLHMASHYPQPVPQAAHNIIIPSFFAAIPFLIRARQCLLMLSIGRMKQDPKRYQHLANAIKYSTSLWPLFLSAYQKTIQDQQAAKQLDGYLFLLQTINALYALYWDIVMDWGMMQNPSAVVTQACTATIPSTMIMTGGGGVAFGDNGIATSNGETKESLTKPLTTSSSSSNSPNTNGISITNSPSLDNYPKRRTPGWQDCHRSILRPRLRFGLTMSALIVLADSILRFSWLLRFVSTQLFVSHDAFVLCTQFLEVFRRSIWNLLRVEWENIKQKSKQLKARDSLSDTEEDDDQTIEDGLFTDGEQEMVNLLLSSKSNMNYNHHHGKGKGKGKNQHHHHQHHPSSGTPSHIKSSSMGGSSSGGAGGPMNSSSSIIPL